MLKAKLCSFVIACAVVLTGSSPVTTIAAETGTESITLSEKDWKEKKAEFEEDLKEACEKWNSLTDKQKKEIYNLVEKEIQAKIKLNDKLVKLGVMEKEDADDFKSHVMDKFNKCKQDGEFPLLRRKGRKDGK